MSVKTDPNIIPYIIAKLKSAKLAGITYYDACLKLADSGFKVEDVNQACQELQKEEEYVVWMSKGEDHASSDSQKSWMYAVFGRPMGIYGDYKQYHFATRAQSYRTGLSRREVVKRLVAVSVVASVFSIGISSGLIPLLTFTGQLPGAVGILAAFAVTYLLPLGIGALAAKYFFGNKRR